MVGQRRKASANHQLNTSLTNGQINLLRRGVAHAKRLKADGAFKRSRTNKLPWKIIASFISEHGGSYDFAAATCAKKWDEVN